MARPGFRRHSLVEQAFALRGRFPHDPPPTIRRGQLTWTVRLQPTPLSVVYTVRVNADGLARPKVVVLDPALEDPWGKGLPHVFPGDELCLYRDEFRVWRDLIAVKLVPWISEWLYYYELWISTGQWLGGGEHPTGDKAHLSD